MQNFQGVEYLTLPYAEERLTPMGLPGSVFFGERKKGLANPTKGFLRLKKTIRHILILKNLEVARFRQCVPAGRQN
jgi:hypothetical protein